MADARTRHAWFEPWIPIRCPAGHPLLPGKVALHWSNEPGCPANDGGAGHHNLTCETDSCGAEFRPPGCTNPEPPVLPRSHRHRT